MIDDFQMPESFYRSREQLAFALLEEGVVKISDAKFSFETGRLTGPISELAARCMAHIRLGKRLPCDSVYGHDKTDTALAEAFSHATGVKRIELDFQVGHRMSVVVRHHGGPINPKKAIIVRHQALSGVLIRKTADEIRETTVEVAHVIALFDWEKGASQALAKRGIELHPVFSHDDLLDLYVRTGKLSTYRRAAISWRAAHATYV